jgi:hypothetical protein
MDAVTLPSEEELASLAMESCPSRVALAVGLTFLRAVDATEADTLRVGVVQNLDGVAVEDGNDGAGEVSGRRRGG